MHQSPTEELWTADDLWDRKSQFNDWLPEGQLCPYPVDPTPRSTWVTQIGVGGLFLKKRTPSMGLESRVDLGSIGRKR